MKEVIRNTIGSYEDFFGTGLYVGLFWLAVAAMLLFEKNKKKKEFFLGQILVFSVVYLFPVTAYLIMNYCIGVTVYWRMFWLLPVTVMIAYMFTNALDYAKGRWQKTLAAALILLAVIQGGSPVYNQENFKAASNYYKLNQDVLVVCEAVSKDAQANGIEKKGLIVPNQLATEIRQYDASIRMPYGRNALRGEKISKTASRIYDAINGGSLDATALAYYAKKGGYQYFAYMTGEKTEDIFNAGYRFVENVGNYDIYRLEEDTFGKRDLLITQYGDFEGNQCMFYTIRDYKNSLVVIDGGWDVNADSVRGKIKSMGGRVDAWILTHPHEDHIGAFCEIYKNPDGIKIKKVYAVDMADPELCMENAPWDSVDMYRRFLELDIPNLKLVHAGDTIKKGRIHIEVLNAYEEKTDELSNDLLNDGSMMFLVKGKTEKMLFCSDVGKSMSTYLAEKYGDILDCDYVQMGHHGNGGLLPKFYETVSPDAAFFDAPRWLFYDSTGTYNTPEKRRLMESLGSTIYSFETTPNSIVLK